MRSDNIPIELIGFDLAHALSGAVFGQDITRDQKRRKRTQLVMKRCDAPARRGLFVISRVDS